MPTQDQELQDLIAAVDGVSDVEIDLREDGKPHVRVWLDGTVPASAVSEEVRIVVAAAMESTATPAASSRRGPGGTRGEILATEDGSGLPVQVDSSVNPAATTLALVAVEETADGVSVRAADSRGGLAFSPVADPRSINQAVVNAVARLRRERPVPRLAGVETRNVSGQPVLTVVLAFVDDTRAVGSALVVGGMPFTLGMAVWEALGSPRTA